MLKRTNNPFDDSYKSPGYNPFDNLDDTALPTVAHEVLTSLSEQSVSHSTNPFANLDDDGLPTAAQDVLTSESNQSKSHSTNPFDKLDDDLLVTIDVNGASSELAHNVGFPETVLRSTWQIISTHPVIFSILAMVVLTAIILTLMFFFPPSGFAMIPAIAEISFTAGLFSGFSLSAYTIPLTIITGTSILAGAALALAINIGRGLLAFGSFLNETFFQDHIKKIENSTEALAQEPGPSKKTNKQECDELIPERSIIHQIFKLHASKVEAESEERRVAHQPDASEKGDEPLKKSTPQQDIAAPCYADFFSTCTNALPNHNKESTLETKLSRFLD